MIRRIAAPSARFGERGIELNKRHSLSIQLFIDVLRSLVAAGIVFALLFSVGTYILSRTVYGDGFTRYMSNRKFEQLQSYVEEHDITADDLRLLNAWCGRGRHIYLVLYQFDRLLYESPTLHASYTDPDDYDPAYEDPEAEYALVLGDGTQVRAFLYYYPGNSFYYWAIVISGFASFLVFSLCFISFVHHKLRYIQLLKKELDILAGGDMTYPVTVRGKDELGELAAGIDQMRRSIAAHQAAEEKMRLANSQLVTAMSHDLRTPLTSLMAYLELMERGKYEDSEQLSHFIHRSLDKALQIKSMTDKLFQYFLVYSSEWEPPKLEPVDADALFGQLFGEYAFSLENHGFVVQSSFEPLNGQVQVSAQLLQRAFDNIYSNLLKYADPQVPIQMSYQRKNETVRLHLQNGVSPQRDKRESTNIGLHTCEKVLRCHGGTFCCREEDNCFYTEVTLPLIPGETPDAP